ncbi:RCC1/BLIP-II protein [Gloeophyllum trabeum ATCC 11539]|uniref:RCC1/BLIP-II protein n=1 Tax=Gloeophyllum trabeum (strain ATCC 11539 / FP-39264 / Madison 617) TaxID=670483 RepID=S7QH69_GLOTA|nr:RCC1/BLIP-II protein [Gloeophyllum trabeum ATCC 11539]EPQ59146.1 RCC1/BLIP-II protein [Gloeophyllum trabeum ATCC 11539]
MQAPYFNPLPIPPAHMRPPYQLWGWGAGNFGQLGMGPDLLGEYPKPKRNLWIEEQIKKGTFGDEEGAGLEAIAAGGMHTIFIDEKGTVWSCGVNDEGALGRVTTDVPNPENPDEKLDVDQLTATPYPLQTLIDENFRAVKIAAGDNVCAAVSTEGELRVWGSFRDNQGSLGFSSESQRQFLPAPILELKHHSGNVEKFVSVASGNNHLLVLTTHGNVYTLGAGEEGQLGRKVIQRRKIHGTAPEKIVLGTRTRRAKVVGAGNNASFAVDERGVVWGWGLNTMGQTGTGYSNASVDGEVHSPKQVVGLSKEELDGDEVVQIAGGDHHTLFLTASGKVYACGRSNDGQLGLAKDDPAFKDREHENFLPTPALVTFPDPSDPVVQVSAGTHNNLAVTEGGALYAWGAQTQGELGIGDDEEALTPTVIVRKQGGSWSAHSVSCGGQHTIALFRKKS